MIAFVLRRLLSAALVVAAVALLTFLLERAVPGGPFTTEKGLPPEVLANLNEQFGLSDPLPRQMGRLLAGLPTFDFGNSMKYRGRAVRDILAETAPVSAQLGAQAFLLAVALGLSAGIFLGWKRSRGRPPGLLDGLLQAAGAAGIALPSFVLAGLLLYAFAFRWPLLPPARWEGFLSTILPSLTLAAAPAATIARFTRGAILETLAQPFVRSARAKGLGEMRVVIVHAVPGALYTVVTVLGPVLATLVTGSFVVETIFGIPGMGRFLVTSVIDRDYTMILGTTVLYTALVAAANLLVDILYTRLDPRVRLSVEGDGAPA